VIISTICNIHYLNTNKKACESIICRLWFTLNCDHADLSAKARSIQQAKYKNARLEQKLRRAKAEREGFEPPEACTSTVFKTAAFDRSAISPAQMYGLIHTNQKINEKFYPDWQNSFCRPVNFYQEPCSWPRFIFTVGGML
jgi:hypothetical protein